MQTVADAGSGSRALATCTVRGSINHDEYFHVAHIVRPGETLSSTFHESRVGGKGANQAVAVALAAGGGESSGSNPAKVKFYGTIGHDGAWIRERMREVGVGVEGILVSETELTGRAIIQVDERGENSIILFPGANYSTLHEDAFRAQSLTTAGTGGYFPHSTHLLLQNEIPLEATLSAIHSAKVSSQPPRQSQLGGQRDTIVIINPSPLPARDTISAFPWEKVDWLIVNEDEARELFEAFGGGVGRGGGDGKVEAARELVHALGGMEAFRNTSVVCTLGAKGVLARQCGVEKGMEIVYVPAAKLRGGVPKDTTGAGDCFAGYFVCELMGMADAHDDSADKEGTDFKLTQMELEKLLKVAVQAAGMCCEKSGTIDSYPTRREVEERMKDGV
ncbi:Ribokinase [Psilocybe cubensis]|uniref:Ribokinase n=2 Tax=Psilocybe cubensis TaxID=181762 RepID=A0ACB8GUV7_PSICU|nr:Ribokinase [Psilocybe cubensis]KAH9478804.1 Ribokinase [Psilocybe cubensis]